MTNPPQKLLRLLAACGVLAAAVPALAAAPATVPTTSQAAASRTAQLDVSGWPDALLGRYNRLQTRLGAEPNDLNAHLDLGELLLSAGAFDEAKGYFLEAVALDYLSADAHFGLGLAEYNRANYRAALFEFGEVTRLFPDRFDGHFNRAVTLAQLRRGEEAVAAFQEALVQATPEAGRAARASAQMGLAGQLETLNRFGEAADAYGAAARLSKRTPDLVLAQSEALYRAGRGLEALPDLTALESRGEDPRVSALIADVYLQAKQTDYALSALNRAYRRAVAGGNTQVAADVLLQQGLLERSLGRSAAAARAFREAAKLTPNSEQAFYNLGVSLLEAGQPERAVAPLNNALRVGGERASGEVYLALATAYDQLNRPAEAQRTAEAARGRLGTRALQLDATAITGRALYRAGNYRGALIALQEVAEARPNDAQAQLWAGLAYYQQGDYTEATALYERAAGLDPDNLDARLNLGAAYLATERYADAESVYTLLVQQNAEDAEAYYNLGWALFSQDRVDEAESAWTTASELGYEPAGTALAEYTDAAE